MKRYTKEHIDYIRSIADNRFNKEIAALFNEKFGSNKTASQINAVKKRYGIKSGNVKSRQRSQFKLFTSEQEVFLKENVPMTSNRDLTNMVNKEFGLNVTVAQVKSWKQKNKLRSGLTGRFEPGQKPWNKGMKGLDLGGVSGRFKKGRTSENQLPIGTERIQPDSGYTWVKIGNPSKWQLKHRHIWEKHNGPIPDGHVILFANGDESDFDIGNLLLVSRRQLLYLNQNDLIKNHAELTETGLNIVNLIIAMEDKERGD